MDDEIIKGEGFVTRDVKRTFKYRAGEESKMYNDAAADIDDWFGAGMSKIYPDLVEQLLHTGLAPDRNDIKRATPHIPKHIDNSATVELLLDAILERSPDPKGTLEDVFNWWCDHRTVRYR